MNWPEVKDFLIEQNFPKFRQQQIYQAYFTQFVNSWDEVTTLSKTDRVLFNHQFDWSSFRIVEQIEGKDVVKFKLETISDNKQVEMVIMKHRDGRRTLCISCQVGCAMGCTFCATGTMGLNRSLKDYEIWDQAVIANRYLKIQNSKVTNIVFMGMGEPMQNFKNIKTAIETLHDPEGFNLGWRHFTISTCGLLKGIAKHMNELPQVNLAVSLHAPNDNLRRQLMPVALNVSLSKLIQTCKTFAKTTKRQIFFEYLMLDRINDLPEHAQELAILMKQHPLFHVNLIKYHKTGYTDPISGTEYKTSTPARIKAFKTILEQRNISVTQRYSFGEDIQAACGQLITDHD